MCPALLILMFDVAVPSRESSVVSNGGIVEEQNDATTNYGLEVGLPVALLGAFTIAAIVVILVVRRSRRNRRLQGSSHLGHQRLESFTE